MDIGRLVGMLIKVGLWLAALGLLVAVTREVKREAMDTARHGMVSLSAFNRRLERGR